MDALAKIRKLADYGDGPDYGEHKLKATAIIGSYLETRPTEGDISTLRTELMRLRESYSQVRADSDIRKHEIYDAALVRLDAKPDAPLVLQPPRFGQRKGRGP